MLHRASLLLPLRGAVSHSLRTLRPPRPQAFHPRTFATLLRPLPTRTLLPSPSAAKFALVAPAPPTATQIRCRTYGQEYQPSNLRRKRRFGFRARLRTVGGRKVLKRRRHKKRKFLSH
eukprot:m.264726 g.264726  ORF g.264726 m.264726 type:complete len:118 (+) comp22776_c1_seq1:490-843(+)